VGVCEAAAAQLDHNEKLVQNVKTDWLNADVSPKLKTLLNIAGKVQEGGKQVKAEDIAASRAQGATDRDIHDTVLIAAMFCMCNRYVDGLGTWAPQDADIYRARAARSWSMAIPPSPRQLRHLYRADCINQPNRFELIALLP